MSDSLDYIGNQPAINVSDIDASSSNTANKIVSRDGSGNFSAGSITVTGLTSSGVVKTTGLKDSSDRTLVIKNSSGTVVWGN